MFRWAEQSRFIAAPVTHMNTLWNSEWLIPPLQSILVKSSRSSPVCCVAQMWQWADAGLQDSTHLLQSQPRNVLIRTRQVLPGKETQGLQNGQNAAPALLLNCAFSCSCLLSTWELLLPEKAETWSRSTTGQARAPLWSLEVTLLPGREMSAGVMPHLLIE